jgi:hemoglobin
MSTFWEEVGGTDFFEELISAFYAQVAVDPILRPMYPESDLHGAAERLQLFLEQYWGGPTTYSELRGHPRLRMRHNQFFIDSKAKEAWLSAMGKALDSVEIDRVHRAELWNYLELAANSLVNQLD